MGLHQCATTAALLLLLGSPTVLADCPASFVQAFDHYSKDEKYSVDAIERDFPATRQPYKMVEGADDGQALTTVGDGVLRAEFPKSALRKSTAAHHVQRASMVSLWIDAQTCQIAVTATLLATSVCQLHPIVQVTLAVLSCTALPFIGLLALSRTPAHLHLAVLQRHCIGHHADAISGKETGFTWYSMLPKQGMKYSMSYKVKFMKGFDWTKGGKLPGLCGGGAAPLFLSPCAHSC